MKDVKTITEEVAKISKIDEVKKYATDEGLDIDLDDKASVDDWRKAIIDAATEAEREAKSGDNDGKEFDKLTPKQIVAELFKDESRQLCSYRRQIKVVNTIRHIVGDNGEYNRICLSFTKNIDGYVAVTDENEMVDWKKGKTDMVFVLDGSIIATIKNNPELAPYYNAIRENPELLYTILAGSVVMVLTEDVPADTEYVNPFSRNSAPKEYDHDWMSTNIYEIVSLGKAAKEWIALQKLVKAGAFNNGNILKGILGI